MYTKVSHTQFKLFSSDDILKFSLNWSEIFSRFPLTLHLMKPSQVNCVGQLATDNCHLDEVSGSRKRKYLATENYFGSKSRQFILFTYSISAGKEVRMLFPISWMIRWNGLRHTLVVDVSTGCDVHGCTDTDNHGPASTNLHTAHWPTTTTSMDTFYK